MKQIARNLVGVLAALGGMCLAAGCGGSSESPAFVQAINEGVGHMGQFNYGPAVDAFQKALSLQPRSVEAKVNLAVAYFNRNKDKEDDAATAARLLDEALSSDPSHLRALYYRGIVYQNEGEAEKAIPCFERVVEARPGDGAAWFFLGLCKNRIGEPCEAELQKALERKPNLVSAHYLLFQILKRAEPEKAEIHLRRFEELRQSPTGETVQVPQYDQMGELALVRPLPRVPSATGRTYTPLAAKTLLENLAPPAAGGLPLGGGAAGDMDGDGRADLIVAAAGDGGSGTVRWLRALEGGALEDATKGSALESIQGALACSLGDWDNDGRLDLFVACAGENRLLRGTEEGPLEDVTDAAGAAGGDAISVSAVFLDADHDADLDIFVCNTTAPGGSSPVPNQLLRNNADGTFTDIAEPAGVACPEDLCVLLAAGDIDGDRDTDLVILRAGAPARIFLNELEGRYREAGSVPEDLRGDLGGVLQDLDGDENLDLLLLSGEKPPARLFLGDGLGGFRSSESFASTAAAAGEPSFAAVRIADLDLDCDLDIALFGKAGHVLLNDGEGRFALWADTWPASEIQPLAGVELLDWTGDGAADLLRWRGGEAALLEVVPGSVQPPSTWMKVKPTGERVVDPRMRSPASGYGTRISVRAGRLGLSVSYFGLWGGASQSSLPVTVGLAGAGKADYVSFLWTDGVGQSELGLLAGEVHDVAENQRKISSCPVLFAWNGRRFAFVSDFAGVGGLGYFVGPGEYASPQVLEHVKIEPDALQPRDGLYELRVTEPMEETAYVDRLELRAIDHPRGILVYPDERLALTGPPPTQRLLVVDRPIFPLRATGPGGVDATESLLRVDRRYAYAPPLDRRFHGFCRRHALELDFGDRLAGIPRDAPLFLFLHGYLEYPYSQTNFAASQAGLAWEPLRIDRLGPGGEWTTIEADAGAFGGMGRMITVDLSGKLAGETCRLRLVTNLEIFFDQIFAAADRGTEGVAVRTAPL
ncbi:MAG: VCBS repeat-containing protein, partial [Planctomycetes bacterium]|nr:VCBS repeat-containing protein [Planctomycetota bacterium]